MINGVATLQEIDTHYDLTEVWDANEALDIKEEAERLAMPRMPKV